MIDGDLSASFERLGPIARSRRQRGGGDPLAFQAEHLQRLVKDAASKPAPRTVHHLRTTIRRFEALLPETSAPVARIERKLRKQLERVRKRAGKVRDVDVHLREIRSLIKLAGNDDYARVCHALQKSRAKKRKRLGSVLADGRNDGLVKRLRRVVGRAVGDGSGVATAPISIARVLERFSALQQSLGTLTAANLHDFRKQTKSLRYLAEVAEPLPETKTAVTQLKRIQDAIGAWHDWVVLGERSAKILDGAAASPLLGAMRTRADTQLEKALAVTAGATRRLGALSPPAPRKGSRPMTRVESVPSRRVGASA